MAKEKRLIDADALLDVLEDLGERTGRTPWLLEDIVDVVDEQPTIEANPVVHGRWKPVKYTAHCSCGKSYGTYHYLCSACNSIAYAQPYRLSYCPNCGAKMDGCVSDG